MSQRRSLLRKSCRGERYECLWDCERCYRAPEEAFIGERGSGATGVRLLYDGSSDEGKGQQG